MGDREARAVGAGTTFTVEEQEYRLSPLAMGMLAELQRDALRAYKKQYLQTFLDLGDSLPDGMLEKEISKVAKWDVNALPKKQACSCSSVPITDAVEEKLVEIFGESIRQTPSTNTKQQLLATAVDRGDISSEEVFQLTGVLPKIMLVPFDLWWVTAMYEGQIAFIWGSLQRHHPNITKQEIGKWPLARIAECARIVELITKPDVGNT